MPDLQAPTAPDQRPWIAGRHLSIPGRSWIRLLAGMRRRVFDPAEPWEIPLHSFDPAWRQGHPSRPASAEELPAGALDALERACGPLSPERLLLLPQTTRLVRAGRCVLTPSEVLAFGEDTAALWIDHGPGGRVIAVPVREVAAIVDRQVLLYGRLELVAAGRSLVVRYNTVARPLLRDSLLALRSAVATACRESEPILRWCDPRGERTTADELPYKWRFILRSRSVRPDQAAPARVAVGDVARRDRHGPPTGVALLTQRELVIAAEPESALDWARYGVDVISVPRDGLEGLAWNGRVLTVHAAPHAGAAGERAAGVARATVALRLDRWLVRAMRSAFGETVRWLDGEP